MNIVTISDTHGMLNQFNNLPSGDLLIHAGDLLGGFGSSHSEMMKFVKDLKSISTNYTNIVIIAGNHDFFFEENSSLAKEILLTEIPNVHYLEDDSVTINDLLIYGSPVSPFFNDWAFNKIGSDINKYWEAIPDSVNILVTHTPPQGILDKVIDGDSVGCPYLLNHYTRFNNLLLHVFGHIHEGYGVSLYNNLNHNNTWHCVNASLLNEHYNPTNSPFIIQL